MTERWHWLSIQYWIWWAYFKIRAWRFWKSLWNLFSIYAVIILLSTAALTFWAIIHDKTIPPEKLSDLSTVTSILFGWILLGAGAICFIIIFIIFIILSSFPRGRAIADRNFRFTKPTELENFKNETERRLIVLEGFKAEIEKKFITDNAATPLNAKAKSKRTAKRTK